MFSFGFISPPPPTLPRAIENESLNLKLERDLQALKTDHHQHLTSLEDSAALNSQELLHKLQTTEEARARDGSIAHESEQRLLERLNKVEQQLQAEIENQKKDCTELEQRQTKKMAEVKQAHEAELLQVREEGRQLVEAEREETEGVVQRWRAAESRIGEVLSLGKRNTTCARFWTRWRGAFLLEVSGKAVEEARAEAALATRLLGETFKNSRNADVLSLFCGRARDPRLLAKFFQFWAWRSRVCRAGKRLNFRQKSLHPRGLLEASMRGWQMFFEEVQHKKAALYQKTATSRVLQRMGIFEEYDQTFLRLKFMAWRVATGLEKIQTSDAWNKRLLQQSSERLDAVRPMLDRISGMVGGGPRLSGMVGDHRRFCFTGRVMVVGVEEVVGRARAVVGTSTNDAVTCLM